MVNLEKTKKNILPLSSHFYNCLQEQRKSCEVTTFINTDIFSCDLLLIPIHHRSTTSKGKHWTVAGIFPKKKKIIHFDSLRNIHSKVYSMLYSVLSETNFVNRRNRLDIKDWNFISPLDINYQSSGLDCGVHVCLNGFMMVQEEFIEIMDNKTYNHIRYWIASKVINLNVTPRSSKSKQQSI